MIQTCLKSLGYILAYKIYVYPIGFLAEWKALIIDDTSSFTVYVFPSKA